MPAPVVTQPVTPRTIAQGVAIPSLSIVASNTPTSYAASPLPAGLTLNTSTGVITGTPTAAGLTETSITATNDDGTSAAVSLVWNVQATPPGRGDPLDFELDYDLITGLVTIPGVEAVEGDPVLRIKRGDRFPVLVGLVKWGVLQDLGEDIGLRLGVKEFEPDRLVEISTGTPEREGTGDQARYRVMLRITPAAWSSILSDYEGDFETQAVAPGEIELTLGEIPELYDETVSVTGIDLYGGIGTGGSGGDPAIEETLVFTDLIATEGASYSLTIALTVTGRSGQNVTLLRTLTITFSGGAWVISDLAGDDEVQGPVEGTQWRVTLTNTDITGDADSVDVDVEIVTTVDTGSIHYVFEIETGHDLTSETEINFGVAPILTLWDAGESEIGTGETLDTAYDDGAAVLAAIEAAWEALTGETEVVSVAPKSGAATVAVVTVTGDTLVRAVGFDSVDPPGETAGPVTEPNPEGTHRTATLTGQLVQDEDPDALPIRRSSRTFGIGVGRDIVPDT